VEYGPGVGTFTRDILERMHPAAKLVAFETNDEFYRFLSGSLNDPRFHLVHESATEIEPVLKRLGLAQADYIISGIPFKTHAALQPQGQFLVYQLSSAVRPYLKQFFGVVRQDFEWLSILPARLFYCSR
jgi:phospholipid N-methyltransferase